MWVSSGFAADRGGVVRRARARAQRINPTLRRSPTRARSPRAAVLQSPLGRAEISSVRSTSARATTASRTSPSTTSRSARSRSRTPRSSAARPRCHARVTRASSSSATRPTPASTARSTAPSPYRAGAPFAVSGLGAGAHTLTVGMRDRFGTPDPTPGRMGLDGRSQPGRAPAAAAAAAGAPTADARRRAGRARQLPVGRQRVAGRRRRRRRGRRVRDRRARAICRRSRASGSSVKVSAATSSSSCRSRRGRFKQAPLSGFVPLKGQAALPIGTVVDTRKGRLSMQSTVDGRRIGAGGRTQTAILSAGIFQIRQRRAALGSTARIPTDLALQSAPGAEASCVQHRHLRADQGPRSQHGARPDGGTREGPVPDRRRGRHQHRDRRDVGDQGPLRRHPHRRRQGHGDGARAGGEDHAAVVTAGRSYLVKAKLFRSRQQS